MCVIEVLNSFWAFEFGGTLFQTLAILESIGYLNLGSKFQDLDRRTDGIWVSGPQQTDRRDLGFKTSTDRRTDKAINILDSVIIKFIIVVSTLGLFVFCRECVNKCREILFLFL
jgi:hypothetical protein